MKIALVSTYRPEECGIATFSENLFLSILKSDNGNKNEIKIVAIQKNDFVDFPDEVVFKIRQEKREDYIEAAKFLNNEGFDICIIQHEYGIFGGESGLYLLSLTNHLRIPYIITTHTVLKHTTSLQKSIIRTMVDKGGELVVMTKKAMQFLRDLYEIPEEKISIIEHGVPEKIEVNKEEILRSVNLDGKKVLMTFGLLGRNKGIETVIRALPKVIEKHPDVVYLVSGITHPNVVRMEGESYRESLISLASELGVKEHVVFQKGFIDEKKLFSLLNAIDIYITPYHHEEQITSGTLSYAIGAGAAVVSTPFWHAQELLSSNRGKLFNFRDHEQLSELLLALLDNPKEAEELRKNALQYASHLRWNNAGRRYLQLAEKIISKKNNKLFVEPEFQFTEPGLNHIRKLTDNIGIYQHAVFGLPNYHEGYCLDDNSRALMAMTLLADNNYESEAIPLAEKYLSFINFMQQPGGWFHNFLSFDRKILDEACSEDAFGRTLWALGMLIESDHFHALRQPAEEIFQRAIPHASKLEHIRGRANTIIGLEYFLKKHPFHSEAKKMLTDLSEKLKADYRKTANGKWNWFSDELTYDNGILPLALFHEGNLTGNKESIDIAMATTDFLAGELLSKGYLSLVGSNGWFNKNGLRAQFAQQAIDAMSVVLLFKEAFKQSGLKSYYDKMLVCYRWFFSENDLGVSLYNPNTEGCFDGLEDYGINKNQGAESTLALFISHYSIRKYLSVSENDLLTGQTENAHQ